MDRAHAIDRLKSQLRSDVGVLYRSHDRLWSWPIVETLRLLRETNVQAVLFGGTLRSLLLSRIDRGTFGRPRDLDIVVSGTSVDELRDQFRHSVRRETRFGGLQLERMNWQFDVWPLERTWAFEARPELAPRFATLPWTTFFNLEAVAIDVWAQPGRSRAIYSGDDQFFRGILDRVLEINWEKNPFPALCVVRTFVFASSTGFRVGPRLAQFLADHHSVTNDELIEALMKHYGSMRLGMDTMRRWLDMAAEHVERNGDSLLALPRLGQMELWQEDTPKISVHLINDAEDLVT